MLCITLSPDTLLMCLCSHSVFWGRTAGPLLEDRSQPRPALKVRTSSEDKLISAAHFSYASRALTVSLHSVVLSLDYLSGMQ